MGAKLASGTPHLPLLAVILAAERPIEKTNTGNFPTAWQRNALESPKNFNSQNKMRSLFNDLVSAREPKKCLAPRTALSEFAAGRGANQRSTVFRT